MSRMYFKCGQSHQAHEINAEIYFCDKCGNKFKQSDILKIQIDFVHDRLRFRRIL